MVVYQNDWIWRFRPTFGLLVLWDKHHASSSSSFIISTDIANFRAASFASDGMSLAILACRGSAGWDKGRLDKNIWF